MKIRLLLLACILATTASAQTIQKGTIRLYATAGVSFSSLINSEAPHKQDLDIYQTRQLDYRTGLFSDMRITPEGGIGVEYFLSDKVSIRTGLQAIKKGTNLESKIVTHNQTQTNSYTVTQTFERKIKNNYIVMPILLRRYLGKIYYVQAGGYAAVLTGSRMSSFNRYETKYVSSEGWENMSWNQWEQEFADQHKKYTTNVDFGLSLGGGLNFKLPSGLFLTTDLLINFGLVKVDNKYDNHYSRIPIAASGNFSNYLITNQNYYGLDSNAKNLNASLTIGIGRTL